MQVADKTVVSIRYKMKNSKGEVLENTMKSAPVSYLHGAGNILPSLEADLAGLEAGEEKVVYISKSQGCPEMNDDFYFDVIIDEVRWATKDELMRGSPIRQTKEGGCGPGCCC